jgi:hypothetical protein
MNERRNERARHLAGSLTGRCGFKTQALAIRYVRQWMKEIPPGDSIAIRCESGVPEKQFSIWKKWFQRHENTDWEISDEYKSFFWYKSQAIE